MRRRLAILCLAIACSPAAAGAQGPALPVSAPGAPSGIASVPGALKVFLDCQDRTPCFDDYVKTEVAYVDYVTIREVADVHVLVTSLRTGVGGREFTMKFVGLGPFAGVNDEVLYASAPTDSEELVRRGFVRTLKLGLVRYALHTALAGHLSVTHTPRDQRGKPAPGAAPASDPWNYWVFRTRLNANLESESSNATRSFGASASASRTTAAWKLSLSGFRDQRENEYTFSDGSSYTSVRRSYDATAQAIKSLSAHWSTGGKVFVSGSTYENKDRVVNGTAAVEFSVFPYSESTRRQLTFQYLLALTGFDYIEETVYGRLSETRASQAARASFDMKQTWGSLSADLDYSQYLNDRSLHRKSASVEADLRLFRGFSLNINARTTGIHDQLFLKKGAATDEEVLARQRQLATSFRHSIRVGFSYTFGSIYSTVVNTRLANLVGGPGGGPGGGGGYYY